MKLLIVTQAVDADSPTLGFFDEWLREFSRRCERVEVIALSVGRCALPSNVRVVAMPGGRGPIGRVRRLREYRRLLRELLPGCDGVFAHMCPEYVIAGWLLFGRAKKPVVLWFAHRARNWKVRLGAWLSSVVATSVPGAFTLPTRKLRPLGQGIPTGLFRELPPPGSPPWTLAAVGRITPIKRLELLIDALAILRTRGVDVVLELWGAPALPTDRAYEVGLRQRVAAAGLDDRVRFVGPVAYAQMPERYREITIGVNACPNGAIDKAVLEAMACGRPVIVTNETFRAMLGPDADGCLVRPEARAVADAVQILLASDRAAIGRRLRATVETHHGLSRLIGAILELYERLPRVR